jgi:hypothetical protein
MLVDDCGKDGCGKRIGEETAELMDKFVMENESLLHERLGIFYGEMDERLRSLPPKEQQQYLEGLVHAFDSVVRHAHPEALGPFDRECFINFAKQMAYSEACDLGLDVSEMKSLIEYHGGVGDGYGFTACLQKQMGIPLTKMKMGIPSLTKDHEDILNNILYVYRADDSKEDKLAVQLDIFCEEMKERLKDLSPGEQQRYLEGLVHAFDSVVRHAHPGLLAPFEREEFIGSVGSWAYSKTYHLKLDPEKRMRKLVESNSKGAFLCHQFAAIVHAAMGSPLTGGQELTLMNLQGIFMIKQMGLAE